MELSAVVGGVTLPAGGGVDLSAAGNGFQLHGHVLYGVAVLIHHAARDSGVGRHFEFVAGEVLAGLERDEGDGRGGLGGWHRNKAGALGDHQVNPGLHVGNGEVAGAVADGAVNDLVSAAVAEIARDEADVNAGESLAGGLIDHRAFQAGRLRGQDGAHEEAKKRGLHLIVSIAQGAMPCSRAEPRCTINQDTPSRSVGIGRRTGLKIRRTSLCVWVQVPPPAPTYPIHSKALLILRIDLYTILNDDRVRGVLCSPFTGATKRNAPTPMTVSARNADVLCGQRGPSTAKPSANR